MSPPLLCKPNSSGVFGRSDVTAYKVEHEGVALPQPSLKLIEKVARAINVAHGDWHHALDEHFAARPWCDLDEMKQAKLHALARAAYASIAHEAGADVKFIHANNL